MDEHMTTGNSITVGILSRNRPEALRRCISSIAATINCDHQIIIAFDEDYNGYISPTAEWTNVSAVYLHPRHYYVRGVNALYRNMKKINPEMDFFFVSTDNIEFTTQGWGQKLMDLHETTYPDGKGVTEILGPGVCSHYLARKKFFDEDFDGYLANPVYTQYGSDDELRWTLQDQGQFSFARGSGLGARLLAQRTIGQIDDELHEEVRQWYPWDREILARRAQEKGWNV